MSEIFTPLTPADIEWRDGLPFSPTYQDVYFSPENGLEESRHVFIDANALIERWQLLPAQGRTRFVIAETGFGTGLNFVLTWHLWRLYAPAGVQLHYMSCEKHPLRKADLEKALGRWPQFHSLQHQLLAQWPALLPGSYSLDFPQDRVHLLLLLGDAESSLRSLLASAHPQEERILPTPKVDAWFLDGFAPARNAAMWSPALLGSMALLSQKGTTAATFSVARQVRDGLSQVGFQIEKRPGYGRKREMLLAVFHEDVVACRGSRGKTAWHYPYRPEPAEKKAIVIGGGLAGACMAQQLALRDWQVVVIDRNALPGQGASGNPAAVLFPYFSAYDSPMSQLMHQAWHFALHFYARYRTVSVAADFQGLIQFTQQDQRLRALKAFLREQHELAVFQDAAALSALAGVTVTEAGFYYPEGGWIDLAAFCAQLLGHPQIEWLGGQSVTTLALEQGQWTVGSHTAPVVILCAGYESIHFQQTQTLPLAGIRGQMSWLPASTDSQNLRVPLCGTGHLLPARNGMHAFGASYDRSDIRALCQTQDDKENWDKINTMPVRLALSKRIEQSWCGVRAVTPDYLPLLGPVIDEAKFHVAYAKLRKNAKAFIPFSDTRYPGLYLCAGFGSRGAVSIPYCSRWLAGVINGEPSIFSRNLQQALSPARFSYRSIIR
ncbi:MAG: bifunctional tRNA (5-methylaminomethyl-2-thiouridine)(34)-methyltransferase MnmD/FAD-dependent 5-carboxymethylaminomethyl-2-thiouridine(34) oxidoreductase MnmC [Legionellaceae bacterium]|nr:bifunctional tRNA (5-methylaminomethyl-2-thiouridine)(34)-methyltransferase MnmD/FAD-dependent 5-carboxymethylaminomethyl-2-thiouridine(34) oxidoreductase MnmC [Legionellaceae bacterium]